MAKPIEKPVRVTANINLMRLLDEADASSPVLLERHGVVYRLSTVDAAHSTDESEDIGPQPDVTEVRRALDETIGSWKDVDVDKMIADIYRWRREGSRNPDEIVP